MHIAENIYRDAIAEVAVHQAQLAVLNCSSDIVVVVSGRRFGKSTTQLIKMLRAATTPWTGTKLTTRPTVLGLMPTLPQCRAVLFNPMLALLRRLLGESVVNDFLTVNKTLMTIDFGENYPLLKFSGTHPSSQDSIRGLKIIHAGLDEAQDVSKHFFDNVLQPALADTNGTVLVTGTPKSKQDLLYLLEHSGSPNVTTFRFSSYANTLIPGFAERLNQLVEMLPWSVFQQEILATNISKSGTYYTEFKNEFVLQKLPHNRPKADLLVGFDPGSRNRGYVIVLRYLENTVEHFAIVHAGLSEQEQLDSEVCNQVLAHCYKLADMLQLQNSKPAMFAVDPSRPELVRELRKQRVNGVLAYNAFDAGINIANTLFKQQRIFIMDKSLVDGSSLQWFIDQIEGYHRKLLADGTVTDNEDTDIPTHTLDGFRYCFATLAKHSNTMSGTSNIVTYNTKGSVDLSKFL